MRSEETAMPTEGTDVFTAALGLPLAERAALAEVLIDSLPPERQAAIDQAWRVEIRRRKDEYERGEAVTIPAEDVFKELLGPESE
jgi:putative addiction module component (TIGR02574 family)